ncbi:MAG: hypothetical protein GXP52_04460 [Deltaproteobacteria bacterium]|nr:hypothetical protein [Deltaproteobacteria bacterium]
MKKKRTGFTDILNYVAFVVVILAVLFYLSSKKYPFMPADGIHRSLNTNQACLLCHSPKGDAPLGSKHPPKVVCVKCHKHAK